MTRITAAALAAFMLVLATTPGHAQQTPKTVAGEQAFYETLTFGAALRAPELHAMLDRFVGPISDGFRARYFKGPQQWPSMCGEQFATLGGREVSVVLSPMESRPDGRSYYFAVWGVPPVRSGDFARLETARPIEVLWYQCAGGPVSHSPHVTADRRHVMFKLSDAPMLAWSVAEGR